MEYEALDEIKHSKKLSKYCGFVYWLQEKAYGWKLLRYRKD